MKNQSDYIFNKKDNNELAFIIFAKFLIKKGKVGDLLKMYMTERQKEIITALFSKDRPIMKNYINPSLEEKESYQVNIPT